MTSSLFGSKPPKQVNLISNIMASGPSEAVFAKMYNSNPRFKQFADSVKGMSPEEAFAKNGLDFNQVRNLRW